MLGTRCFHDFQHRDKILGSWDSDEKITSGVFFYDSPLVGIAKANGDTLLIIGKSFREEDIHLEEFVVGKRVERPVLRLVFPVEAELLENIVNFHPVFT